ncbi:pseudouridine synthase [Gangjinia marincola]|uniref:Pseudouridine synthase n=1 Tax=Gangjinia marincola TaxID=578463 RepID=A0ABN1MEF9_9FLAO
MDHQHFKLYKPDGYLSQLINNSRKRKNKKLVSSLYDFPMGAMCVGRLDEASEGLLLLTTDGMLSHYINSSEIEKEYYAQVDGVISSEAVAQLSKGVEITHEGAPYVTKPCHAVLPETSPRFPPRSRRVRDERHGPTSWICITLTEGKFRQVRKMTAAVGFPTLRLVRTRIGRIKTEQMLPGEVTPLKDLRRLIEAIPPSSSSL